MQVYTNNSTASFIGTKTEKRVADLLTTMLNCVVQKSPQSAEQVHGAADEIDSLPKSLFAQSCGQRTAVQNTIDLLHAADPLAWATLLEFALGNNAGLCAGMYDKLKVVSPWADRELVFAQMSPETTEEPLSGILVSAMKAARPDFKTDRSTYTFVYKMEDTLQQIAESAIKLVPVVAK